MRAFRGGTCLRCQARYETGDEIKFKWARILDRETGKASYVKADGYVHAECPKVVLPRRRAPRPFRKNAQLLDIEDYR